MLKNYFELMGKQTQALTRDVYQIKNRLGRLHQNMKECFEVENDLLKKMEGIHHQQSNFDQRVDKASQKLNFLKSVLESRRS